MTLFKKKKKIDPAETTQMIRRVLSENFSDHKLSYAKAIAGSLMISGATVFVGYIMRDVINDIFYKQRADLIAYIAGSILLAFVLRGLGSYIQAVQLAKIGNNLAAIYQKRVFAHLMKLGLNFYNDHRSGHLAAQINQNIGGMRDLMNMTITSLARDAVMLVGLICIMVYQEPYLSLYSLLIAPPLILTVTYVSRRIRTVTREVVHLNSHLLGAMQETTQGIAIVKAFTMEDQLRGKINGLIELAETRSNKIASVSERVTPISEILAGIAIASVIAYAGYRAIAEQQPPGTMFAFITSMMLAYDPARRLARLQVSLERALVNARMIYEILDLQPAQSDRPDAVELKVQNGTVRFEDVQFAYHAQGTPEHQQVLKGVSFIAKAGETTAIVGASGAGKSTLIALIQRFYDVNDGRILIDDQDIAGVTVNSLRHSIAYVSQQPYLFEGTIADNIRYGRPDTTEEEIIEAAKLANAHEFIIRQPQGYDSPVGENGVTLSGGQRQRLSIARAIVRNAPILLLDEATSALDNDSEKRVQQALETIMKDRTTIVIAHRLSTVVSADKIIVMEAGNIVEEGRHADLISIENGIYARFYQLQSAPENETLIG
ncbi:ABC transporter ATP-binding protein [Pseudochrobactrum saccharolyticum]|uniref:ATP-binding cassette subfamily B protein n=1 Tax=Pseudochrobactrum saccharolyticum TaxID=354352 RepID=A0A7W8AKS5_9HYPH|nr:ABC transporter ATP-binding protein [Pseudochrobactrum saccharolyticum]KAB0537301.1 ABC transporter ATP-binding protein [Pseudochrobactrum saccharolyticum]MBB5092217.1 ATP-binding cassette subfamily B protein [Pseudochrobactrum saccharolyticum]MDP8252616.1 ABC transporter ATP-binding protein [Pseudochrobactrum saccharolyticum]